MTEEKPKPKLLTVPQLAAFLQVGEETVRRYTRSGDLKCSKLGRQLRFSKEQVEEFLYRFADTELPPEPEDTTEEEEIVEAQIESDSEETTEQYLNEDGDYL